MTAKFTFTHVALLVAGVLTMVLVALGTVASGVSAANASSPVPQTTAAATTDGGLGGLSAMGGGGNR